MNTIRCSQCSVIAAEIKGDALIIQARHHGEKHITVIPLDKLIRKTAK